MGLPLCRVAYAILCRRVGKRRGADRSGTRCSVSDRAFARAGRSRQDPQTFELAVHLAFDLSRIARSTFRYLWSGTRGRALFHRPAWLGRFGALALWAAYAETSDLRRPANLPEEWDTIRSDARKVQDFAPVILISCAMSSCGCPVPFESPSKRGRRWQAGGWSVPPYPVSAARGVECRNLAGGSCRAGDWPSLPRHSARRSNSMLGTLSRFYSTSPASSGAQNCRMKLATETEVQQATLLVG